MANTQHRPNVLLDGFVPALSSWSLVAAASLGIFDALSKRSKDATEVANELNLDVSGTRHLLCVLSHLGYLEHDHKRLRLSDSARALTQGNGAGLAHWMRFCRTQLLAMTQLQAKLKGGPPVDLYSLMETPEDLRIHQMAMAETAMPMADWVARNIPVPNPGGPVLDIGGSHGLYSATLHRLHPRVQVEILELPEVVETSRAVARELGTAEVVHHIEGDIYELEPSARYAVVFAGNLIHHCDEERLPTLLELIRDHLIPGGTVALWDIEPSKEGTDLVEDLFSLFFHLTSAGKCHSRERIRTLFTEAGFINIRFVRPESPSLHTLYLAHKPQQAATVGRPVFRSRNGE